MRKLRIWTAAYNAFVLGGNPHAPLATDVSVDTPECPRLALGHNFYGYVVTAPDGRTVVAEATTGAIVGNDLDVVKDDIATGDLAVMQQQVAEAAARVARGGMRVVSAENFWAEYPKKSSD